MFWKCQISDELTDDEVESAYEKPKFRTQLRDLRTPLDLNESAFLLKSALPLRRYNESAVRQCGFTYNLSGYESFQYRIQLQGPRALPKLKCNAMDTLKYLDNKSYSKRFPCDVFDRLQLQCTGILTKYKVCSHKLTITSTNYHPSSFILPFFYWSTSIVLLRLKMILKNHRQVNGSTTNTWSLSYNLK